jgi:hypothetical protein
MVKANRLELDHGLTGVAPYVRPVHNGTFMWGGGEGRYGCSYA